MPFAGTTQTSHYRILIRRGEEGSCARLYPFNVQETIPRFSLPLQAGDAEPIVDLGELLRQIYLEARYRLRLDYSQPPAPALAEADAKWASQILQNIKVK